MDALFLTVSGAYILSAFFIMGISAYHLLKKQHVTFFTRSFQIALAVGLVFSLVAIIEGHMHTADLAEKQPAKLAAMETLWETGEQAPIYLFSLADQENEKNSIQIGAVPGLLSLFAYHDTQAVVKGLKDFPKDERPPVVLTSLAFKGMVVLGLYFAVLTAIGVVKRNRLLENPRYLKVVLFSIPLPYIASQLGWIVAEVGRQPWIVYGLMKTSDAASPVVASQVLPALIALIGIYGLLGAAGLYLIYKTAVKGPENNIIWV
jgi:cytochrome d ubiquinol oxidase subunit I